jgi:hypothetical protein
MTFFQTLLVSYGQSDRRFRVKVRREGERQKARQRMKDQKSATDLRNRLG